MARLIQNGAEEASASLEFDAVVNLGVITIETTIIRGLGLRSYKFNPAGSGQVRGNCKFAAADGNGPFYGRMYFQFNANPGAIVRIMGFFASALVVSAGIVRLTTAGKLQLLKSDGTQLGADSAALTTGHWYRLEIKMDETTNPGTLTARYVDCGTTGVDPGDASAVTIATGSNSGTGGNSVSFLLVGLFSATVSNILYVDDIAVNDTTGAQQNSWCGSGSIFHMRPNAAGAANAWETQVGGTAGSANNYTRVNEVTPDDASSYNATVTLNREDLFVVGASGLLAGTPINVVMVGNRRTNLVGADAVSGYKLELQAQSGTKTQGTQQQPNSTSWTSGSTKGVASSTVTLSVDPDGATWTVAHLDACQVGYVLTAAGTQKVAITAVWLSVDAVPTTAVSNSASVPVEALGGLSTSGSEPVESLGGLSTSSDAPVESLAAAAAATAVPLEALAAVAATLSCPVEALAAATASAAAPVEATSGVDASGTLPLEAASGISQSAGAPLESLAAVAATLDLPLEALAAVTQVVAAPVEALAAVAVALSVPLESLVPVVVVAEIPLESLSAVAASSSELPLEALASVYVETGAVLEALAAAVASGTAPLETLAGIPATTISVPLEALEGVLQALGMPLEALVAPDRPGFVVGFVVANGAESRVVVVAAGTSRTASSSASESETVATGASETTDVPATVGHASDRRSP